MIQNFGNIIDLAYILLGFWLLYKLKLYAVPIVLIAGIYQLFHKDKRIIVSRKSGNKWKE